MEMNNTKDYFSKVYVGLVLAAMDSHGKLVKARVDQIFSNWFSVTFLEGIDEGETGNCHKDAWLEWYLFKEYPNSCYKSYENTIDPGVGYRLLKKGERIQEGDDFWSISREEWLPTMCNGEVLRKDTWTAYRRKIEAQIKEYPDECYGPTGLMKTPKDGYRFLKLGEKVQKGDLLPYDFENMTPTHWVKAFDIGDAVHADSCAYIRKVEETKEIKEYPHKCYEKGKLKDPGRGYRWLKVGETPIQGDEVFRFDRGRFVPITISASGPSFIIKPENGRYRRKVERRNTIPQETKQPTNTLAKDLKTSFEGQKRKFKDKIRSLEECLTKRHEESTKLKKELKEAQEKLQKVSKELPGIKAQFQKELETAQKKIKDLEFANSNMAQGGPNQDHLKKAFVRSVQKGQVVEIYSTNFGWIKDVVKENPSTLDFSWNFTTYSRPNVILCKDNMFTSWRPWLP